MELLGIDIDLLNSITKYPHIDNFHVRSDDGKMLVDMIDTHDAPEVGETLYVTEKIDGTNGRLVIGDNFWLVGSKNQFIDGTAWVHGDAQRTNILAGRFPKDGTKITNALYEEIYDIDILQSKVWKKINYIYGGANNCVVGNDWFAVIYFEAYGGKIQKAAKEYRGNNAGIYGVRYFDVAVCASAQPFIGLEKDDPDIKKLKQNHLKFVRLFDRPSALIDVLGIQNVPYRDGLKLSHIPLSVEKFHDWMKENYSNSKAKLAYGDDVCGNAEGIVIRNGDRSWIRKARFEDYEKTFRMRDKIKADAIRQKEEAAKLAGQQ